jgi:hypothetical protein
MNDYIRRVAKFIFYLAAIIALAMVVFPLLSGGKMQSLKWNELIQNQRSSTLLMFFLAYAFVYPLIAYVKVKRHLNGTFADNREVFERVFETLQYIKTAESADKIVYRRKSKFARFAQWYEDSVVIDITQNPVIISGLRKGVARIDRMIDQLLIRASE